MKQLNERGMSVFWELCKAHSTHISAKSDKTVLRKILGIESEEEFRSENTRRYSEQGAPEAHSDLPPRAE